MGGTVVVMPPERDDTRAGSLEARVEFTLLGRFEVAVDSVPVDARGWTRRQAAALVKLLALAPARRLHREQVIDLLWPEDTVVEAVPKLHKAAHFARRAIDVPNAVALRAEQVLLCPDVETVVDVERFEDLARRALAGDDGAVARQALASYGGELLPDDRYEPWAEERREQLRLRHRDLLRLDGAWERLVELDPSDELAHVALMRRHAANGDWHAALRQFERLTRALGHELGVGPGREAVALRDRIIAEHAARPVRDAGLIGREDALAMAERALREASGGRSQTLIVSGVPGIGKTALLGAIAALGKDLGFRVGTGTAALIEGAGPYAPVVEALAALCRGDNTLLEGLAGHHRREIERVLAGGESPWSGAGTQQPLFVAAAELIRASPTTGLLLIVDDVHDADDASLRLLHYLARSAHGRRVCILLSHRPVPMTDTLVQTRQSLLERHGAAELPLGPLGSDHVAALVRRQVGEPTPELVEHIAALGRGIPFVVIELARRAADGFDPAQALDAGMIGGVSAGTREVLQRVAVVGSSFDTDEFVALSGRPEDEAFNHLDAALAALVVEPASAGYRFRHALLREALLSDLHAHRRRHIHREAAARLIELRSSAARIGYHLFEAGAVADAVPYLLRASETHAAVGAYRDALALLDVVRPHATGAERDAALGLRADLLNALGDPTAVTAYREALDGAAPGSVRRLRVRLARSAMMSGDLDTAGAALDGLHTDGGDDDADILLTRGKCAYFTADFRTAQAAVDQAQRLVLAGERSWKVLDLVTLQAMLAHRTGGWFDRMRLELHRTRESPETANTIFDGYLCAAEYLLYGPMPYAEVIAVARDLQTTARRSGALRAGAFASALVGEAALLSGDLPLAQAELSDSLELHRETGSLGGEAHALQRLAEVHLARGERDAANRLLQRALPLAGRSMLARHLLHRVFGTLIVAAVDPHEARAIVDRAEATVDWDEVCAFCAVMLYVPATIACARVADLVNAQRFLDLARHAATFWDGTSWKAAIAEAQAAVAGAAGDPAAALEHLRAAAEAFDRAGQPTDAERCRRIAATQVTPTASTRV